MSSDPLPMKTIPRYCHDCGALAVPDSVFCHRCTAKLSSYVTCPGCASPVLVTHRFCNFCGASLHHDPPTPLSSFRSFLSNFTESRLALIVSVIGLAVALYPLVPPDALANYFSTITFELRNLRHALLFSLLFALSLFNLRIPIIPDRLVLPGIITALLLSAAAVGWRGVIDSLAGLLLCGLSFLIAAWVINQSYGIDLIGGGTVKLAAMIGGYFGLFAASVFLVAAIIFLVPKYVIDVHVRGRNQLINTAPYLSLAALVALLYPSALSSL